MKAGYDLPTAVTFLIAGLGLGAFLARLLVAPYSKGRLGAEWEARTDESISLDR